MVKTLTGEHQESVSPAGASQQLRSIRAVIPTVASRRWPASGSEARCGVEEPRVLTSEVLNSVIAVNHTGFLGSATLRSE